MLILALESSAVAASAAVMEDGRLLGESYVNTRLTHSRTLMPMVKNLLLSLEKTVEDFGLMAISAGPGSFTGVRIGVSCVKGLAFPNNTPCCGVSTLEAIAWGAAALEGAKVCAVMDARCGQVYQAMFSIEDGRPRRLYEDRALSIEELATECEPIGPSLVLMGDGAQLCQETFRRFGARLAPEALRFQRASSVALAAFELEKQGKTCTPDALLPSYLRLPQAERELKKKEDRKREP